MRKPIVALAAVLYVLGSIAPSLAQPTTVPGYGEVVVEYGGARSDRKRIGIVPSLPQTSTLGLKNASDKATADIVSKAQAMGMAATRAGSANVVAVEATLDQLDSLLAGGGVERVFVDRPVPTNLDSALPAINGGQVHAQQAKGLGQTIVVLDSGVQANHPFLAGRIVEQACFSTNSGESYTACPNGLAFDTQAPPCVISSHCKHGTHVAGIVGSKDSLLTGAAPDVDIVAIQVFSNFPNHSVCKSKYGVPDCPLSWRTDQIAALQYVYDEVSLRHRVASVNMSLGGGDFGPCANDSLRPYVAQLRARGIAVVISAGNDQLQNGVGSPGCIPEATTVGASMDDGSVAYFSNSGAALDLMAPGMYVTSSVPGTGSSVGSMSGTSMAAPMVAGAIAALQSYLSVDIQTLEQILKQTGRDVPTINPQRTVPMINMLAAFQKLDEMVPPGDFIVIRDTWNDIGGEPDPATVSEPMYRSPDIWVRNQADCAEHLYDGQNPEFGQPNIICVALRNSGRVQALGTLEVFISPANVDSVASWTRVAVWNTATEGPVPPRGRQVVPLVWQDLPAPGHYCLVALWTPQGGQTGMPPLPKGLDYAVRQSKHMAWRNVDIIDAKSNRLSSLLKFQPHSGGPVTLAIDISSLNPAQIKEVGQLIIQLGGDPRNLQNEATSHLYEREGRTIFIPLKPGTYYIPDIDMPRDGSTTALRFSFDGNKPLRAPMTVDVLNVEDIAAHKAGAVFRGLGNRYVLRP